MPFPDDRPLQQIYNHLWETSQPFLARGDVTPYPLPGETEQHWGISLVMYLLGDVANHLVEMSTRLSQWTGQEHIFCTRKSLHTTICTLEFYRHPIEEDDKYVSLYTDGLKELCQQFGPLTIHYQGLTASRTSILAQGWPLDKNFQQLRLAFHEQLKQQKILAGPEKEQVRDIAHASLISFLGPLPAPQQCVTFIQEHRETDFGSASVSSLALVRYQRSEQRVEPIILATVPLN